MDNDDLRQEAALLRKGLDRLAESGQFWKDCYFSSCREMEAKQKELGKKYEENLKAEAALRQRIDTIEISLGLRAYFVDLSK
jgi:hypothetical protein